MSGRLPYGIRAQTGAASFKREVEQSLAPWREMIARDDARVVRSIHCPQVPNSPDGFSPVVLYQIALRDSGKIVQVSIQGKHDPLPNPVTSWSETAAQARKRKSAASSCSSPNAGTARNNRPYSAEAKKAAALRRLQAINEDDEVERETHCQNRTEGALDAAFDNDDGEEELRQRKRAAYQAPEGEGDDLYYAEDAEQQQHHYNGAGDYDGGEEMETAATPAPVIAHVSLHPLTPQKRPSKPSSRQPGPPRYSVRRSTSLAGQGLAPAYGLDDLREPDGSIRNFPSTAPNSEAGEVESCSGDTVASHATYTQSYYQRGLRRSSRLASLAPGALDEEVRHHEAQLQATTHRLAEVELVHPDEQGSGGGQEIDYLLDNAEYDQWQAGQGDVDMSSDLLDYDDPEEARLAREQIRNEAQRQALNTENGMDEDLIDYEEPWIKSEVR